MSNGIFSSKTAVIASGQSLSGSVALGNGGLLAIAMPAAWSAAGLTFQVSMDGSTWADLYDDGGNEVTATVAASRAVAMGAAPFAGVPYVRIRSGTSGSPVNQAAERTLAVYTRQVAR